MDNLWQFMDKYGFSYISTAIIVIIGLYVIFNIMRLLEMTLINLRVDNALIGFVTAIAKILLYLGLLFICLSNLNIPLTGIVSAVSAVTLAIGLAIQDIIGGVANGIMLVTSRLFKVNDYVTIGSYSGVVKEIKLLHTVLTTIDKTDITIPNKTVFSSTVINNSVYGERKFDLEFGIDYDADIDRARKVILDTAAANGRVLKTPAPAVVVSSLADSEIRLTLSGWAEAKDLYMAKCTMKEEVIKALISNDIALAYPQVTVSYRNGEDKA